MESFAVAEHSFREITGRKNLGGGLLKAAATDMKLLPIDLSFDFAEEAKEVFEQLKDREPKPIPGEVYTAEHLLIDDMVVRYFGFADSQENIRQALIEQVHFRMSKGESRRTWGSCDGVGVDGGGWVCGMMG